MQYSIIKDIFFNNGCYGEDIPVSESSKKFLKDLKKPRKKLKNIFLKIKPINLFGTILFCRAS